MRKFSLSPIRQELMVLTAGLIVYAVYLPLAFWVDRDFVLAGRPDGKLVEQILKFERDGEGGHQAQVYRNARYERGLLYEGPVLLEEVDILPLPSRHPLARFIRVSPRDGSDPADNGRHYYLVQP